jgi:hypothetical protein
MSFHSVAKHALTVYYDGNAELAGKVLDGIASELAEQIRAEITGNPLFMSDFIDPEVTS